MEKQVGLLVKYVSQTQYQSCKLYEHTERPSHTAIAIYLGLYLLCLRGLLEGGFSRITTLWISLIQILSYHELAFL